MNPATTPSSAAPAPLAAASEVSGGAPAGERLYHVLLVDDSAIVCGRLTALIHQLHQPIRVGVATDGAKACAAFAEVRPNAVVLDLELPGASGFDLLAQFKLQQPGCVVIVLTTYAYPEFRENALRLGADYFFSKAMEFERVTEVLGAMAALRLSLP